VLVLELPELSGLPPEVEEGSEDVPVPRVGVPVMPEAVFEGETVEEVVERDTTGGALGVASGSLPAAFASTGSNEPVYTLSIRHAKGRLVEATYGIIQVCPMRDRSIERNVEGVSGCDNKPPNRDMETGFTTD
jgi:hypothetical protein